MIFLVASAADLNSTKEHPGLGLGVFLGHVGDRLADERLNVGLGDEGARVGDQSGREQREQQTVRIIVTSADCGKDLEWSVTARSLVGDGGTESVPPLFAPPRGCR